MIKKLYLALIVIGACCPIFISGMSSNYSAYLSFASVFVILLSIFLEYWLSRRFFLACFCFGVVVSAIRLETIIDRQLAPELEGKTLTIYGFPLQAGNSDEEFQRFQFRINSASDDNGNQLNELSGSKVRLSWKTEQPVYSGANYQLKVRLKRPRGLVNPGGFDYQAWLLSRNISATGYVRSGITLSEYANTNSAEQVALGFRQTFLSSLDSIIDGLEYQRIMKALIAGNRQDLRSDDWLLFQRTGTVHLMAISGLHIGLIASFGALGPLVLGRLFCAWIPFNTSRIIAAVSALVAALCYAWLAGFSVPTLRALLMVIAFNFAFFFARNTSATHVLLLVALILIFVNPLGVTQPGFVLSFAAVMFLIYCFSSRLHKRNGFVEFLRSQFVLLAALFSILMGFSLPIAFFAPLANIIAVPLVSFVILPLLFLATLFLLINDFLALKLFELADWFFKGLFSFLSWSAQWELRFDLQDAVSPNSVFLLFIAVVIFLAPRSLGLRPLGVFIAAIVYLPFDQHKAPTLTVLDVGQGLSIVLSVQDKVLVYDLGAAYSSNFSMASRVVTPFLRRQGLKHIDQLWVSHADNDHAGDLSGFLALNSVAAVYSGEPEKLLPIQTRFCGELSASHLHPDLDIKVLWPNDAATNATLAKVRNWDASNNRSCVLYIRYQDKQILFSGDIEASVERELLASGLLPTNIDLLIAPHHGSNTSSTLAFVNHVKAAHVVFSSGYKNRYRHPSDKVVNRYRRAGATMWGTAHCGALVFNLDSASLTPQAERRQNPKAWYLQQDLCH